MNWQQIIEDLVARAYTYKQIGDLCGMSKGHVHDVGRGRHDDVLWHRGEKLRKLHMRVMRKSERNK